MPAADLGKSAATEPLRGHAGRPPRAAGTRLQAANLLIALMPGIAAFTGWWALRDDPRVAWLDPRAGSWHFLVIAVSGVAATLAGVLDWRFHRAGHRVVCAQERRAETFALLVAGFPLLAVMALATLAPDPGPWFVPAVALALAVVAGVCFDEFTFHRRCSREETLYHRTIELGMGVAWIAWAHGCFVARVAHA